MTLALYRKYRPRAFSEMIGQEHVTEPLSQALRTGRLHHAYLFSGPRGCGKTSSARILARSLNCAKGPTPDPCGECDSCRALAPDGAGSIDVIEIDAASHGGVDDARDLRERAFFAPVSSRFKVYVIDEAHMVSPAGFNALLKLVEEPPEYVKFVFATTEPEKVLGTIKSRTHHYPFRLIPPGVLRPYLESLCGSEGVAVEPAVFPLVVRAGGGSVRDSLSVLDQLIAGAGDEGVTYARAVALLGVTDVALIDEMCDALAAGDGAAVYSTINQVAEAGHDARRFAGDLLERLRNLIILQQVPDAIAKGLLDGADGELARMAAQADRFGAAMLSRMADIVHTGLTDMRGTTAPRLVLELIAARMLLPGADDSAGALLARMERMERRLTLSDEGVRGPQPPSTAPAARAVPAAAAPSTSPVTTNPRPTSSAPTRPDAQSAVQGAADPPTRSGTGRGGGAGTEIVGPSDPQAGRPGPTVAPPRASGVSAVGPLTSAPPARPSAAADEPGAPQSPGTIDAAAVRRIWDEVLSMIRRKSPKAAAVVREATVREVDGSTLVLLFKHSFHAQAVAGSPAMLQDALYEILGGRWAIRCEISGQQGAVSSVVVAAPSRSSAESAPPPSSSQVVAVTSAPAADDEDWPTTAKPGGIDPAPVVQSAVPGADRSASAGPVTAGPAKASPAKASGAGAEEPPFDPEFDGPLPSVTPGRTPPPAAPVDHIGFDPGDEPLDDDAEGVVRASSEQQAIDLLRSTLGAEKIAE